jgi:hypothetical protein
MNNYRLSTNTSLDRNPEISKSLIEEVLSMEDIYIKDKDGLRINAITRSQVKNQLFFIIASGSNDETLIFKGSKECGDYFGITSKTVNVKLATGNPLVRKDNIEFILSRRPI